MSRASEPRIPRLLLQALVRGPESEFVLGDIEEEYQRLVGEKGLGAARHWYRRQALSTIGSWWARNRRAPIDAWWRDARHAIRGLRRAPGYSVTIVLTLSLGVGGAATVAALIHSVLRPLPFLESDRLVAVWETKDGQQRWVAPANYLDWRRSSESFSGIAAYDTRSASITLNGLASRHQVAVVSGNFFSVLGVEATLGRTFDPEMDTHFSEREAVLAHPTWSDVFGGDTDVVGKTIQVDDVTYEVVGVAPKSVDFRSSGLFAWLRSPTEAPQIAGFQGDLAQMRDAWYFRVVARLAPRRSLDVARQEMNALAARLEANFPETNRGAGIRLIPLLDQTVLGVESTLIALALAVTLVLLAACVNVTHLTLARGAARAADVAIKVSFGASQSDVRRLMLIEGWTLGLGGGGLGVLLAAFAIGSGQGVFNSSLPRASEIALRPGIVGLALLLSLVAGTCIAWIAYARGRVETHTMKAIRADSAGAGTVSRGMIAMQVAATIALLAGTGLMARSVYALAAADLGFEQDGLITFRVAIPDALARPYEERLALYEDIQAAVAGLPGVTTVGIGSGSPLAVGTRASVLMVGGPAAQDPPDAGWQPVDPEYFSALGLPLRRGRGFTDADGPDGLDVAIVNQVFVRIVLDGRDPIGTQVTMGLDGHDRPLTIVGVVSDTRTRGPAAPPAPVLYRPISQTTRFSANAVFFAVRTAPNHGPELSVVRGAVRRANPGLPVYGEAMGSDLARPFRQSQTALLYVLAIFATTALLLGLVGVYGVTSYSVRQRRREIGVRLALGANQRRVTTEIVGRGMRTAVMGVPVGLGLAVLLGRALDSLLFGVPPTDVPTLAGVATLVLVATAGALYGPARLAASMDPAEATRDR